MISGFHLDTVSLTFPGEKGRHFNALHDVSCTIGPGDTVALIGPNGAGKSTLLRLMGGILEPTSGRLIRRGRIQTIFDIVSCLDEDASGYENIFIRGFFLGQTKREIRRNVDEIVAFADLGEAIDRPIRTYSSGMRLRLAFAASIMFESDILLIDEIIGVGDLNFFRRATARMQELIRRAGVVVISSHSVELLRIICNRAIHLDSGRIVADGNGTEVINGYLARAEAEYEASRLAEAAE